MKRIILLSLCCFILLCAGCSQREDSGEKESVTEAAVSDRKTRSGGAVSDTSVTATAVMTGEAVIGKSKKKQEKKTVRNVIDPTGKKRKLKIGRINTKKEGIKFCSASPLSDYAQVYGGHYYYLRSDGSNYTIYRDKGKKVGQFSLNNEYGYIVGFTKYGADFYAITEKQYIYKTKKDWEAVEYPKIGYKDTVVIIDLKKNKVVPLQDDKTSMLGDYNFYENSLIYYNEETDTFVGRNIRDKNSEIPIPIPATTAECRVQPSFSLQLIDGKWYFGTMGLYNDVITLWSLDLTSWKREKLFCYKPGEEYNAFESEDYFMKMDNDYIYSINYIIPLAGGRMIKLPGKIWRETICSNKKYIYYIDEKFRIHRITKKTMNHTIFSGIKAVDVQCTENSVYATGYHKKYYGDYDEYFDVYFSKDNDDEEDPESDDVDIYTEEADANDEDEYFDKEDLIDYSRKKAKKKLKVNNKENPDSFDLYCMDLDGNHRKRLWKGKIK